MKMLDGDLNMWNRWCLLLLFLPTGIVTSRLLGQLVQVGPSDPNFCEKGEHLTPNLRLAEMAHISGILVDDSGAPFKTSHVELRIFVSAKQQHSVKTVVTDEHGQFDLGKVDPGQYRLLASSTRAFAQPQALVCTMKDCKFNIKLHANPTDLPLSICPIR
jgi:hypothetical protein